MSEVKKENIVNFSDRVKIVGAKGAAYLEEGKEYEVHPIHAKTLIASKEAVASK